MSYPHLIKKYFLLTCEFVYINVVAYALID